MIWGEIEFRQIGNADKTPAFLKRLWNFSVMVKALKRHQGHEHTLWKQLLWYFAQLLMVESCSCNHHKPEQFPRKSPLQALSCPCTHVRTCVALVVTKDMSPGYLKSLLLWHLLTTRKCQPQNWHLSVWQLEDCPRDHRGAPVGKNGHRHSQSRNSQLGMWTCVRDILTSLFSDIGTREMFDNLII